MGWIHVAVGADTTRNYACPLLFVQVAMVSPHLAGSAGVEEFSEAVIESRQVRTINGHCGAGVGGV